MLEDGSLSHSKKHRQLLLYESTESSVIQISLKYKEDLLWSPGHGIGFMNDEAAYGMWSHGCHFSFPAVHNRPCKLDCFSLDDWHSLLGHLNGPESEKEFRSIGAWPVHLSFQLKLINTENANMHCLGTATVCCRFLRWCQHRMLLAIVNRNGTRQMPVYIYLWWYCTLHAVELVALQVTTNLPAELKLKQD